MLPLLKKKGEQKMLVSVNIMKVHDKHCENFIMKSIVLFLIYDNKKEKS